MTRKPTYEELEQRLMKLEREQATQRQAEQMLREKLQFSERIFQSLLCGIYIHNVQKRRNDFVNPEYTTLTGWTLDEINNVITRHFKTLFHPEDLPRVREHYRHLMRAEDQDILGFEHRFRTKDGRWIWCFSRDNVFERNEQGEVVRFIGSFFDITERKHTEQALLQRDAILDAMNFGAEELIRSRNLNKNTVDHVLSRLGEATGVSRVYVYENQNGDTGFPLTVQRYGWTATGFAPRTGALPFKHGADQASGLGQWEEALRRGELVEAHVGKSSSENSDMLLGQGAQSVILVPLFVDRKWWGYMGFDACEAVRKWLNVEIEALTIAASMLGLAIERKQGEDRITASLKEKEVLLREIHHRVKNNLQVTSSLLNLQSRRVNDPSMLEVFKESENRIKAMALAHDKLYQSDSLASIKFRDYVEDIVRNQFISYGMNMDDVAIHMEIDDILIGIDIAAPCGMIISELVANSLKYAFPSGKKGSITLTFRILNDDQYEFMVKDDGIGLPDDLDVHSAASFGLYIVRMLAEGQLGGKIDTLCTKGTEYRIRFKTPTFSI